MTRWLVRFGYDGSGFSGWARQPAARTIEGVLRDGLRRRDIAPTPEEARLEVASRTDRGVSARANALALWSGISAGTLLRRLNAISPELFFTAAVPIPPEFRVRAAIRRVYRYFDPGPAFDPEGWCRAARLFQGRVDVRSFGRGIPARSPQWRTVESVVVEPLGSGRLIEVRAPSFVWGMVRKIVGTLREVDQGRLPLSRLEAAIVGKDRLTLPMAEPEGLVLWEVEYPLEWETPWGGPNRHQASFARTTRDGLWRREEVLDALFGGGRRTTRDGVGDPRPARAEPL
jgi:tRNA pseudouridine38-40 synthase